MKGDSIAPDVQSNAFSCAASAKNRACEGITFREKLFFALAAQLEALHQGLGLSAKAEPPLRVAQREGLLPFLFELLPPVDE